MSTLETRICVQCGYPRNEHWLMNFADGPHVGKAALVCPISLFRSTDKTDPLSLGLPKGPL
jgi:hypothetical protein